MFHRSSGASTIDASPLGAEPDGVTRYGRVTKNDYIGVHTIDELYRAINALRRALGGCSWRGFADGVTPEQNSRTCGGPATNYDTSVDDYGDILASQNAECSDTGSYFSYFSHYDAGGRPLQYNQSVDNKGGYFMSPTAGSVQNQGESQAGYAVTTVDGREMTCTTEFYNFGQVDGFDSAPATGTDNTDPNLPIYHKYISDANGQTIDYDLWRRFHSVTSSTNVERVSSRSHTVQVGNFEDAFDPPIPFLPRSAPAA